MSVDRYTSECSELCHFPDDQGKWVYYDDYQLLESRVRELEADLETEKDHSKFLGELVQHLYGDGWENLTIHEAKKLRARQAALVEVKE